MSQQVAESQKPQKGAKSSAGATAGQATSTKPTDWVPF
jgi:hypothetical protein